MYSFEEIMRFHPDNQEVYNEIKRNLSNLIPFVGAGLTQFAYYSWADALNKIANKITDEYNFYEVQQLINKKGKYYLEAAQRLEDLRTPNNLARDIANLFSPEKLNSKKSQLPREAIWLLPLLFTGLVITTNFDQTLETVYKNSFDYKVFEHNQLSLLNQYLTQATDYPGILKLHGTVSGDFIEYNNIVFTEKQYEKFYDDGSTLTESLTKCLEQKTILFLGCSLSQDRTMDILESVLREGRSYYTIINCEKSERDQKINELGKKHIRAILYEGDRHEAIRVILEHLLEETHPDIYKTLEYHEGKLKSLNDNRFTYDSEIVPLVGREDEMKSLTDFLGDSQTAFKWWAITGPGGSGKSRLAYELKKQLPDGWKSRYLGSDDYDDLSALADKLTEKTLLIADYVQEHAKELGKFMARLNRGPHNLPLRVLLVEREANDESGVSSWVTQLYSDVHDEAGLKNACYKEFLNLQPLSDDNLKEIIRNYAIATKSDSNKNNKLMDEKTEMLLQKLKTIDPDLCRPLYAMFLTDAYIKGSDPERWNREYILDYVIEREIKRLDFNIEQIIDSKDGKLLSACKYLQCVATVLQDVSMETFKVLCPEKWDIIEKKAERFESPEELLTKIGLAVKNEIPALRPDLVGEYYVFDWLIKQKKDTVDDFLNSVWKTSLPTAIFFSRMLNDYEQLLNDKPESWDILIPDNIKLSEKDAIFYSFFLVNAISFCNMVDKCEKGANILEQISSEYPDVIVQFAKGLVNLCCKQNELKAEASISKLESLKLECPEDTDLAVVFASGLFNLSSRQDEQKAEVTISKLESLKLEFPKDTEISIIYAKGLFNLSNNQDEQKAEITINKLKSLHSECPGNTEITVLYAQGLVNLSGKQDEHKATITICKLESLKAEYSKNTEIAVLYAKGLFNLSNIQEEHKAAVTINKLESLKSECPEDIEIAIVYASGLVNLSSKQDEHKATETISKLESLKAECSEDIEIVVEYTKGLVNLSSKQDEHKATETISKLDNLRSECPKNTEIAVQYAKGLYNLGSKQDEYEATATINKLESLRADYSENTEIAVLYAKGLFNLSYNQDEHKASETISRLETLKSECPKGAEIAVIYANGLFNLSNKQDEHKAIITISKLENLKSEHPEDTEIVVAYAKGLVNLSKKQNEYEVTETISKLERLRSERPKNAEIAAIYANGLFNLSNKQYGHKAIITISKLERLKSERPKDTEIAVIYANSLFNLSNKQDEQRAAVTISKLEILKSEHPKNTEIVIGYAKGLVNLSINQVEYKAKETVSKLENLSLEHPEIIEIIAYYAISLKALGFKQSKEKSVETEKKFIQVLNEHPAVKNIVSNILGKN